MPSSRAIRILLAMACDGVGPAATCVQLANGMHLAGGQVDIFAIRRRIPRQPAPIRAFLAGPLAWLPFHWIGDPGRHWAEARFLAAIRPGDIAWLWPAASLETHRVLNERGIPMVLEGINTRMASAKRILDAAYAALGEAPAHGITQARIDGEEEKYRHASAIFAPSRTVAAALSGTSLENAVLASSYGVDSTLAPPTRTHAPGGRPLTYLFCGRVCVRKGAHLLLEAWRRMPGGHRLRLVGNIEPLIARRYRDLLASERVETTGFVRDVHPHFTQADVFVFPSLEEGDPLVTYEAALHGLPILASPMGAGRLGDTPGAMLIVEPRDSEHLLEALERMAAEPGLRRELGLQARHRVAEYDWRRVGAQRAELLQKFFVS